MTEANEFDLLASLLGYPGKEYLGDAGLCLEALAESDPEAAVPLSEFLAQTRSFSPKSFRSCTRPRSISIRLARSRSAGISLAKITSAASSL